MLLRLVVSLIVAASIMIPKPALSDASDSFSALGVIASNSARSGVALIKHKSSGKTTAVRVGSTIVSGTILKSINEKTIEIAINNKNYILRVGEDSDQAQLSKDDGKVVPLGPPLMASQFEREGSTVKVSSSLRDHIVNERLGEVLMQAAAVPYLTNGGLAGFTLWDIEPNSVFDLAGIKSGDTITSINGTPINNVGATIRLLNSLKKEPQATVEFLRDGKQQNLQLAFK